MSWNFNCSQMRRWLQLLGFYSVLWFPFIYLCVFVFWGTNMPSALWFLWSRTLSEGLAGPFPGMLVKIPSFTTRPSTGQLYYLSGKFKVLSLWKVVVTSAKVFVQPHQCLHPAPLACGLSDRLHHPGVRRRGGFTAYCLAEWKGEEERDFVERQERLTERQLRTPARDKDLGTDSKPIEVDGNISMGLGPDLFREMKWRNNKRVWERNKSRGGGGRWHSCKQKSDLAGRRGPGQLEMKIGVGSAGVWQMTWKCWLRDSFACFVVCGSKHGPETVHCSSRGICPRGLPSRLPTAPWG